MKPALEVLVVDSAEYQATTPPAAETVFGSRLGIAERFAGLLARHGTERGLIGPREVERLWERHLLNSAVLEELIPHGASVVDVGSGAGLPGVPLAIARPDLDIVLLEPMARRVGWLNEVEERLGIGLTVLRGRAEERAVLERLGGADIVTARALAPLARLSTWCLPLARPGGSVLAMKGASAQEEVDRDGGAIRSAGGIDVRVVTCGTNILAEATTVVSMTRAAGARHAPGQRARSKRARRSRK